VPKNFFKPPKDLIQEWPEVFDDLYMSTMPVEYLHSIRLEFSNGRVWEISVEDHLDKSHTQTITDRLISTLNEYRDDIKRVDFQVDIDRLKDDIINNSKNLF
jgi:hypothetical protein